MRPLRSTFVQFIKIWGHSWGWNNFYTLLLLCELSWETKSSANTGLSSRLHQPGSPSATLKIMAPGWLTVCTSALPCAVRWLYSSLCFGGCVFFWNTCWCCFVLHILHRAFCKSSFCPCYCISPEGINLLGDICRSVFSNFLSCIF